MGDIFIYLWVFFFGGREVNFKKDKHQIPVATIEIMSVNKK